MESDIPTHQTGMYKGHFTVQPPRRGTRPSESTCALCFADFFPMFDVPVPLRLGLEPRGRPGPEPVVVLGAGDEPEAVRRREQRRAHAAHRGPGLPGGRRARHWRPMPKFYDPTAAAPTRPRSSTCRSASAGRWRCTPGQHVVLDPWPETFEGFLQSEAVWIQMWVQLDTAGATREYRAFLDAYVRSRRSSAASSGRSTTGCATSWRGCVPRGGAR